MISFNNMLIGVGDKVIILQTPIYNGHNFLYGEVVALTSKQVQVKTFVDSSKYGWETGEKYFKRYPEQIIVV